MSNAANTDSDGNIFQTVGNWFGASGTPGQQGLAGFGALGMLGSGLWGALAGPNKRTLEDLNANLSPMQSQIDAYGDMINMYKDPMSQFNQQQRELVRTNTNDAMYDMAARNRAQALGTGYEGLGKLHDRSAMTDIAAQGLFNLTGQQQANMQQIQSLMGQQGQMQNALSQAKNQNYMYAMQQAQQMPQLMNQQLTGLFKHAMVPS